MKKEKIILTILLCAFIFAFIGCATTSIGEKYPERWEKTKVGMTLEEFKTVWPNAKYKEDNDGAEVYIIYGAVAGVVYSGSNETFVFRNNKLEKWRASTGNP